MTNILDDQHDYSVSIPKQTPQGQAVAIQSGRSQGAHFRHAETPDQSELYFEVATYSKVLEHDGLARKQQAYLRKHASDGQLTAIRPGVVGKHIGTTFDFQGTLQGRWKVRRFLFVDCPWRTYRIVYDPTSTLNGKVLSSLRIGLADDL